MDLVSVFEAVAKELEALPEAARESAVAAAALELGRSIDQGLSVAQCTKELRACMAELSGLRQPEEVDEVDELRAARAARRAKAAGL